MLQANPSLTPALVRDILTGTAHSLPDVPRERQGAGAVHAGRAVGVALRERHNFGSNALVSPQIAHDGISFVYHDHQARAVALFGSWNDWSSPGVDAREIEAGLWHAQLPLLKVGVYVYKFLVDGHDWVADPANPHKSQDGFGGVNTVFIVPG
jgi:hypothetical protein